MVPIREMSRAEYRHDRILSTLRTSGFRSVADLANDLDVSDMTVRRDLRKLEAGGAVRVVHGGASLPAGSLQTSAYDDRHDANLSGKRRIALAAAQLVDDADTIAIDAGTTAYEFAASLPSSFTGSVVTASIPVIHLLASETEVDLIGVGGDLYRPSRAFVGPSTVEFIEQRRFHRLFLGAGSVDAQGLYVAADVERPTKLALMASASDVVLLVDSTKFDAFSSVRLCDWDHVSIVVTDAPPNPSIAATLEEAGVTTIVAD